MDIEKLRREYTRDGLRRNQLKQHPIEQFSLWFDQAVKAEIFEPNAMTLSTVGKGGQPSNRIVLLKKFDQQGLVFFTNLKSQKAQQIEKNPNVALLFAWLPLERQVRIEGVAEKVSSVENEDYFASRPRESQLGAWASPQSEVVASRSVLEEQFQEKEREFKEREIPLPEFWGGFRVVPRVFEFWQGGKHRLHDRFQYKKNKEGEWDCLRLAP